MKEVSNMYYTVYDEFVTVLGLKGVELLVFSIVYNAVAHMNGYVSLSFITTHSGASHSHVCRVLNKFEDRGWITRTACGIRRKNKYAINIMAIGLRGAPIIEDKFKDLPTNLLTAPLNRREKDKYYCPDDTRSSATRLLPIVNNL